MSALLPSSSSSSCLTVTSLPFSFFSLSSLAYVLRSLNFKTYTEKFQIRELAQFADFSFADLQGRVRVLHTIIAIITSPYYI